MDIPLLQRLILGNTDITADCLSILVKKMGSPYTELSIANQVNFVAMLFYRKAILAHHNNTVFIITVHPEISEASCVYLPDLAKFKMTWLGVAVVGLRSELRPKVNSEISLEEEFMMNPRSAELMGSFIAFNWLHNYYITK